MVACLCCSVLVVDVLLLCLVPILFLLVAAASWVVFDRIAYICDTFGHRFSGSQALEDAMTSIKSQMVADGLEVAEEPVMIPKWVRGAEYAKIICKWLLHSCEHTIFFSSRPLAANSLFLLRTAPRIKNLHFLGLGMSNGTNGKPISAEIIVVDSFADLTGSALSAFFLFRFVFLFADCCPSWL